MSRDTLAQEVRWVAWRNELRRGKPTEVSYARDSKKAKTDDTRIWGTGAL